MKRQLYILLLFVSYISFGQITAIPDANFEQELIDDGIDTDGVINGQVATIDISGITYLSVFGSNIANLTGIEDFTALQELYCAGNDITNLDLSSNSALLVIDFRQNSLTALDLSNNTSLTKIDCAYNNISNLDLSANILLEEISCEENPNLSSLNISQNNLVTRLECHNNNLTALDVTHMSNLDRFMIHNNLPLNNVNVTGLLNLQLFSCHSGSLTNVNVTTNIGLEIFSCGDNPIGSVNVTQNSILKQLQVYSNGLSSVDLSQNPSLNRLSCSGNPLLTTLDLSNNPLLEELNCQSTPISDIDLSHCTNFRELYAQNNSNLNSLNVKNGNNINVTTFNTTNTSNLTCIFVDDIAYSTTNWASIDTASTFVETQTECDALTCSIPQSEIDALQIVFTALGGTLWTSETDGVDPNDNWDFAQCPTNDWYGITISNISGQDHVTELRLSAFSSEQNNVVGFLPDEIGDFPMLTKLHIEYADLTGTTIPSGIGNLTNLVVLELGNNHLEGLIPATVSGLTSLTDFYADNNDITGIPTTIGLMTALEKLYLRKNDIVIIPTEIGNLSSLTTLNVAYNLLTTVPTTIDNLSALIYLDLSENVSLTTMPVIPNLTSLQHLWINNCTITGDLPLINSPNAIIELDFSDNDFTGELPTEYGSYTTLKELIGYNNPQIGGTLPTSFSGLSSIEIIQLRNIGLNGGLIEELSGLTTLTELSFRTNNLMGTLPASYGNLVNLDRFYISQNNLEGEIPASIGNIDALQFVYFFNNNFSGTLPSTFDNHPNLNRFLFNNNNFENALPNFTGSTNMTWLNCKGNKYQFGDFENEFLTYITNLGTDFGYNIQQKINLEETQNKNIGDNTTITTTCSGTQNNYQWYKGTTALTNSGDISGVDQNTLTINNLQTTDTGVYHCKVTSDIVTGLTIERNDVTINVTNSCSIPQSEIDALLALYNSTNGANWTSETDGDITNDWDITNPIENWFGLTVDCTLGTVTKIELIQNTSLGNNLTGVLPVEIGDFPNLATIDIENNAVSGNIPNEIGNLSNLNNLFFNYNQFSGSIPIEIGNLSLLRLLYLGYNNLDGVIPSEIGNLSGLQILILRNNALTGQIPTSIANCPVIFGIYLNNNQLTGSVPVSFQNISTLKHFFIQNNNLNGAIPDLTGAQLEWLAISSNAFQFGDFENEFTYYNGISIAFWYSPQAKINTIDNQNKNTGDDTTMTVNCSGSDNIYQWYKDNFIINDGGSYTNTQSSTLQINNIQLADAGVYHCRVTSNEVNDLTIYRNDITLNVTNSCSIPQSEIDALLTLYNSTNGANWTSETDGDNTNNWDITNPIENWFGLTVDCALGTVTGIELIQSTTNGNNLVGVFSPEIQNLVNLSVLSLENNTISGTIIPEIYNLTNLTTLNLNNNPLTGVISNQITNLTNLSILELENIQLTGTIIPEIYTLTNLSVLNLKDNQLTGTISTQIENLPNLTNLNLGINQLNGIIVPQIGNLVNLERLNLGQNELTGVIPTTLGNLINLNLLWLYNNQLTGTVPNSFQNLVLLSRFYIFNNNFSGNIPDLTGLSLSWFVIHNNAFQFGDFESEFVFYDGISISFDYSPQDKIDIEEIRNKNIGDNTIITTTCSGSQNNYKWFKNNVEITGETNNTLVLNNLQTTDAGIYHCKVTSDIVTGLTIERNEVTINVAMVSATEGPGGVINNNVFWVKANQGIILNGTDVSGWVDQSSGNNDAAQVNMAFQPAYNGVHKNYNPGVFFNGDDEYMNLNDLVAAGNTNINVFAVGTNKTGGDPWHVMVHGQFNSSWTGGGYGISALNNSSTEFGFWVENYSTNHVETSWIDESIAILEGKYDSTNIEFFLNAQSQGLDPYSGIIGDSGMTYIGGGESTDYNHKGFINEIAIYDTDLTPLDRQKINSYFAIKYGITLDRLGVTGNYVNSLGNSVFTDTGIYWNDIIGIGRDDTSTLLQKQSHQDDDNARIYLTTLNTDNNTNIGTFTSDNQFVMMSHNNAVLIDTNAEKPASINSRIEREWKLTNTNFDGVFNIDIKLDDCISINSISDLRLLVDIDSDFSNATIYDNSGGLTITVIGNYISITGLTNIHLPQNNTTYITIGSVTADNFVNTVIANPIPDINTCDDDNDGFAEFVLDLISIENQIIGSQIGLTVSYYDTLGNLITLTNPYTNTTINTQAIIARVTNVSGCFDETTFNLTVNPMPEVDELLDVTECGTYELPPLTNGNYFELTGGAGEQFNTGDNIENSQTLFIYVNDGTCENETSFEIVIYPTPGVDELLDVIECGSYELPPLTNGNYFTLTGGTGIPHNTGDIINSSQTLFIYANDGTCENETSFEITINSMLEVDELLDVTECGTYELPPLTNGNYFELTGGAGMQFNAGDNIENSQTLFIYVNDGICENETSFEVFINPMPEIDELIDVFGCGSYELPSLTNGNYFELTGGEGTQFNAGNIIESSQTLFIYANDGTCENEISFEIIIYPIPIVDILEDVTINNAYELPSLSVGNYYTEPNGQGDQLFEGDEITSTQILYIYEATGEIPNLCFDESDFLITINPYIDYMHFFTPNGNGENDYWQILGRGTLPGAKINIFDRYGKLVAQIDPNGLGWDGNYHGRPLPSSDYWFTTVLIDGSEMKGNFSLLRN